MLRNALRFNPSGQRIDLQATQVGDHVRLSVRDHGPGVADEHLAQLGEPFYRAPGQTTPGHGLGLAIVTAIMQLHGGRVEVAQPAVGRICFSLIFPAA
ncbi:sensor histidine kinase [Pseudomonas syringae]|uniref:sensor histidine kinase n=1 Tax=Pseudomonas syringae TaxID=317 RepID=UPI0038571F2D